MGDALSQSQIDLPVIVRLAALRIQESRKELVFYLLHHIRDICQRVVLYER